jgi:general secretion pathway protein G
VSPPQVVDWRRSHRLALGVALVVGLAACSRPGESAPPPVAAVGGASAPKAEPTPEAALMATARSQAKETMDAFVAGDFKTFAARTLPKVVAGMGGADAMVARLQTGMRSKPAIEGLEIGAVDLYPVGAATFAVVHYTLAVSGHGRTPSCLIGRTEDAGAHWYFVDGGTVTIEQVRKVLPDLPAGVQLPATGARAEAERKEAEAQATVNLKQLADTTALFRMLRGKLPGSLAELTAKDERGNAFLESLPKDPWGNDYTLHGDGAKWWIASVGPDGTPGTDDDLVSKRR